MTPRRRIGALAPAARRVAPWVALCVALALGGGCAAETDGDADAAPTSCPPGDVMSTGGGASGGGGKAKGPSVSTAALFDGEGPLRVLNIAVKSEDWAWLREHALDEVYVPATVSSAGEPTTQGAIRFKGAYGSLFACFAPSGEQLCPKLSLKVSFNETDKKGRMFGVRKLVLNGCPRDESCLRERLAYSLFADADIVTPRAAHVLVRINGGPASLYTLVESIDKEFLEDHFDDPEGNLYKEAWPQLDNETTMHAGLKTNEAASDVSHLLAFAEAVAAADDASFAAAVAPFIDTAAMARYLAVDQFTNNWDGVWKFYCGSDGRCRNHNFYLYDDPKSGRFVVIPWDLDHTFNWPNTDMARSWWDDSAAACVPVPATESISILAPQCDPLLRGLMRQGWQAYAAALSAWTAPGERLDVAVIHARLDRWRAQIRDAIAADPLGPGLVRWLSATAQLREAIVAQHAEAVAVTKWKAP